MYFHSVILSHVTYCLTSWSNTQCIILKPMESLYKQVKIQTLYKQILDKNNFVFNIVIF